MKNWELQSDLRQLERALANRSVPEPSADLRDHVLSSAMLHDAPSESVPSHSPDGKPSRLALPATLLRGSRTSFTQFSTIIYCISAVAIAFVGFIAWEWAFADFRGLRAGAQQATALATENGEIAKPKRIQVSCDVVPKMVARVTGMKNCVLAKESTATSLYEDIPFGHQLRLESGFLEITYCTGLKVLLEGPSRFEVSSNGGHLAYGRLVGVLDKKPGYVRREGDSEKSLAIGGANRTIPSFTVAIRTPTTGLVEVASGLEFGMKVADNGSTLVHVFRGSAALCSMVDVVAQLVVQPCQILRQEESVQIDMVGGEHGPTTRSVTADAGEFTRRLTGVQTEK